MFGILVLLGGAFLAGSLVFDNGNDQEFEEASTEEEETETGTPDVSGPADVVSLLDVVFPNLPGETVESDENDETIEVSLAEGELTSLPGPLEDWVISEEVPEVSAGEGDLIIFDISGGENDSLAVMPANYTESPGGGGSDAENTHTGFNVYFVPEGEEFPEDYEWSEDGATLYNTSDSPEDEDDFGGIRFIARIDTGSFGTDIDQSDNVETVFDTRTGTPAIESNLDIVLLAAATSTT
ncbi:hypothetical protein [Shimia sp.]|uniref:hypothetical protein n=1 Tax=Shimia sp. TaxID=1954381 RepID=UPI003B8D8A2B